LAYPVYVSKLGEDHPRTQALMFYMAKIKELLSPEVSSDHPEDSQGQEEYPVSAPKGQ